MKDQHHELAEAALAWNRSRVFVERLKDARGICWCERAELHPLIEDNTQEKPCWKNWHENADGDDFARDPEPQWCASCQLRQLFHNALRLAMATRGARLRGMQRRAYNISRAERG